jgi:hypothetical protein
MVLRAYKSVQKEGGLFVRMVPQGRACGSRYKGEGARYRGSKVYKEWESWCVVISGGWGRP